MLGTIKSKVLCWLKFIKSERMKVIKKRGDLYFFSNVANKSKTFWKLQILNHFLNLHQNCLDCSWPQQGSFVPLKPIFEFLAQNIPKAHAWLDSTYIILCQSWCISTKPRMPGSDMLNNVTGSLRSFESLPGQNQGLKSQNGLKTLFCTSLTFLSSSQLAKKENTMLTVQMQ